MGATDGDEVMVSGMVENVCVCLKRILGDCLVEVVLVGGLPTE